MSLSVACRPSSELLGLTRANSVQGAPRPKKRAAGSALASSEAASCTTVMPSLEARSTSARLMPACRRRRNSDGLDPTFARPPEAPVPVVASSSRPTQAARTRTSSAIGAKRYAARARR